MMGMILVMVLCSTIVGFSQNGWFWQNPYPHGAHLNKVQFISSSTGWAVGNDGLVLKTTDGGASWQENFTGSVFYELTDIQFFDLNNGVAAGTDDFSGDGIMLKSTDGGESWTLLNGSIDYVKAISFINPDIGYAAADEIYKTTDGGNTWNEVLYANGDFHDVYAILNNVTAVGFNGIYRSTDGGANWVLQASGLNTYLSGIHLFDNNYGIVIGSSGTILKTTNGGITWLSIPSGTTKTLTGISFSGTAAGVICGEDGIILKTTDGGNNWTIQASGTNRLLRSISLSNLNNGTAVADYGTIIRTTNGGASWFSISKLFTTALLYGISSVNSSVATAAGRDGEIIRTTNGGSTWVAQQSGVASNLNNVSFSDADKGMVVGDSGTILYTTNGGENWIRWNSTTIINLYAVHFIKNTNIAYAAGYGHILKTTDGGINWTQIYSEPTPLFSMNFINENTGFVAGSRVLKTTNGGVSWITSEINSGIIINAVSFSDENHGAMAGNTGEGSIIFLTTNGGVSWEYDFFSSQDMYGIYRSGINDIFAAGGGKNGEGSRGEIHHSTDGGNTWTLQYISVHRFFGLSFLNSQYGYVVGEEGTILWTNNGGVPVELISFTASVNDKDILLTWETATEINNKGFEVERKSSGSEYKPINFIPGNGTTTDPKIYQYMDKNVFAGIYTYRLKQVDFDGNFAYSNEIKVNMNTVPDKFTLHQSYPNPFNPVTRIKFEIPSKQMVELKVYDLLGREAAVLTKEELSPGIYERDWDASGYSSGIYYYRITAGTFNETRKMILVK
jgi:photosystem II stability/assembly factor-like uncharacterized protein